MAQRGKHTRKKKARLYNCMQCTTNKMRATMTLKMMKAENDSKKSRNITFKAEIRKKLHLFLYVGQRPFTYTASHTMSF